MSRSTVRQPRTPKGTTTGHIRWIAPSVLLAILILAPAAAAYSIPYLYPYDKSRQDVHDPYYLVGYLGWSSGKGSISWGKMVEGDSWAGPGADSTTNNVQYAGATSDHALAPPAPSVEFVSEPLTSKLFLNSSRNIEIDLMIVQTSSGSSSDAAPCSSGETYSNRADASPEVKLFAGDVLVTGAAETQYISSSGSGEFYAPSPAGYSLCRYRIPTEVAQLDEGTVLRLVVTPHMDSFRIYQYGVNEDAASVLRLPYYSEDEVFYRFPDAFEDPSKQDASGSEGVDETGGSPEGAISVGGLGLAAVAGLAIGRRRLRPTLSLALVAAFVSIGFAGCLGAEANEDDGLLPNGSAVSTIEATNGSLSSGAIMGLVHDDINVPVAGAHIALLGTPNSTQSDSRGRFQLKGLTPGSLILRVDRADFNAFETKVDVVSGSLTRVDITLIPLTAREAGARPHRHDYWDKDRPSDVVRDGPMGQTCTKGANCVPKTTFRIPATQPGQLPNLIRPGTEKVEVTITWDAEAMGVDKVGLAVVSNYDSVNSSFYDVRASPATFTIVPSWEMADAGHQLFSTWQFLLYSVNRYQVNSIFEEEYYTRTGQAAVASSAPEYSAKVTIYQGKPPLEPPHPEQWGDLELLEVDQRDFAGVSSASVLVADALFGLGFLSYCATQTWLNQAWTPELVVPVGTTWVEVVAKQNRVTGTAGVGHWDWALQYKPGNVAPTTYIFPTMDQPEQNPDYIAAPAFTNDEGGTKYVWKIPVTPDESDSIYNKVSAWGFAAYPNDMKAACIDTQSYAASNPLATSVLTVKWTVIAHRTPLE